MSNFPLAIIYVVGAAVLPVLPRQLRSAFCLLISAAAFVFLINLETGASLTFPFLNYELVVCRVDQLSLAFGYVFVIMGFQINDLHCQINGCTFSINGIDRIIWL